MIILYIPSIHHIKQAYWTWGRRANICWPCQGTANFFSCINTKT